MVEVTIALGVAGFCLLSIFGLLPVGLASNQTSIQQTVACNIASSIVSDLRMAVPLGIGFSPRYRLTIPPVGSVSSSINMQTIYIASNGTATSVGAGPVSGGSAASIYRATVFFNPPGQQLPGQRDATSVRVLISWPALADPVSKNVPSNYTGSYYAETALDCN